MSGNVANYLAGGVRDKKNAPRDAYAAQVAAQDRAIEEQRRQFEATRQSLMPFIQQGQDFIGQVGEGATLGGFASNLNDILNSPVLDQLRQKRLAAINSQFGHTGGLGSGTRANAIANDLTDYGMGIENLLFGRQSGLETQGLNAAQGLGGFGANASGNISNLLSGEGEAQASGILGSAQAKAALMNQLLQIGTAAATGGMGGFGGSPGGGFGGMNLGTSGYGNSGYGRYPGGSTTTLPWSDSASNYGTGGYDFLFSDRSLKTNIRPVGEIGPLTIYEWEWIPEVAPMNLTMTSGFIADEVEQIFPKFVHKIGRFSAIDYQGLMDKLDEVLR